MGSIISRSFTGLICIVFSFVIFCNPSAADVVDGVSWLKSRLNADGSYTLITDRATSVQSTAETLRTFYALGEIEHPGMSEGLRYINDATYRNTEYLSRMIIANAEAGKGVSSLVDKMLTMRNTDGGFAELAGHQSTVFNTAFALEALGTADVDNADVISEAIKFIASNQRPDGGFSLKPGADTSVHATALVLLALQRFQSGHDVNAVINSASEFLYGNLAENNGWMPEWEVALGLLALAPLTEDAARVADATNALRLRQSANGSWNNDIYATALALRALYLIGGESLPGEGGAGGETAGPSPASMVRLTATLGVLQSGNRAKLVGVSPRDFTSIYHMVGDVGEHHSAARLTFHAVNLLVQPVMFFPDAASFAVTELTGQSAKAD